MNAQTTGGGVRITNVTQRQKQGLLPLYSAVLEQPGACLTSGIDKVKCEALGRRTEKNSVEAKGCESKSVLTHRDRRPGESLCSACFKGVADDGEPCLV